MKKKAFLKCKKTRASNGCKTTQVIQVFYLTLIHHINSFQRPIWCKHLPCHTLWILNNDLLRPMPKRWHTIKVVRKSRQAMIDGMHFTAISGQKERQNKDASEKRVLQRTRFLTTCFSAGQIQSTIKKDKRLLDTAPFLRVERMPNCR